MKILFVASECAPIAKVGGLGDVIQSLPKALNKLGLDVRIVFPKYSIIEKNKYHFDLISKDVRFNRETINIFKGLLPASQVPIYLLENEKYFSEDGIYFEKIGEGTSLKEIERFLFFSQLITEITEFLDWRPQIIHCHDWHTSFVPLLLKLKNKKIKTLLTIHNLANQGKWNAKKIFDILGLKGNEAESLKIINKEGNLNIFEQGIFNADILNTVSNNYAKEIKTKEYGEGLEQDLIKRKNYLFGILNGIDYERFNPKTDSDIENNYSLDSLDNKAKNKAVLQKILNFSISSDAPLLSVINRLTTQKGVDLISGIIPELVKLSCQLVILGVGEDRYEKKLLEFSKKYPKNISVCIKFDPVLAQKIYAGSDIFLMPSQFEPCGLGQMIAMRYGTLPIVRKTGGLAETVQDEKTGFVFEHYKKEALLVSVKEALDFYKNRNKWQELIENAMNQDFSWKKSAKKYLELYEKLI